MRFTSASTGDGVALAGGTVIGSIGSRLSPAPDLSALSELIANRQTEHARPVRGLRLHELPCRGEQADIPIREVLPEQLHGPLVLRNADRRIDQSIGGVLEPQQRRVDGSTGGQGRVVPGLRERAARIGRADLREQVVLLEAPLVAGADVALKER